MWVKGFKFRFSVFGSLVSVFGFRVEGKPVPRLVRVHDPLVDGREGERARADLPVRLPRRFLAHLAAEPRGVALPARLQPLPPDTAPDRVGRIS